MMETNVNYTLVGAFVILLLTAIVMGVIWLSSGLSSHTYTIYQINMKESVTGLTIDSAVEFNGVSVGTVKSITLMPNDPQTVVVLLNVDTTTPVTQGTTASITSKGLTGVGYVSLIDKGQNKNPLVVSEGQSYPIIKTIPSLFNRFDTALVRLNENISKVTEAITKLLDQDNLSSVRESLANIRDFTQTMVAHEVEISTILHNTATVSAQLPILLKTSASAMQAINQETVPVLNQAMTNLQEVTQNMVSLTQELKQNPAVLIRGKAPQTLGPGER
jgi:phospholipid/cholesterol/gamma-HCH transport system substrate-binding protein